MRSPRGLALGGALAVLLLTATGVLARNLASDPGVGDRLTLLGRHELAELQELPVSVLGALRAGEGQAATTSGGRQLQIAPSGVLLIRETVSAPARSVSFDQAPPEADAVAIGPSVDSTDDPTAESVYLLGSDGLVYEYGSTTDGFVTLADGTATLVDSIDTSDGSGGPWDPDSPDPSGIAWWAAASRLVVVDGEVDETTGAGFHGANGWVATAAGQVTDTFDTTSETNEATGVTVDTTTGSIYIASDGEQAVFELDPGGDGQVGTGDDTISQVIDTLAISGNAINDPEGIAFANGDLYLADGVDKEIYHLVRSGGGWVLQDSFDVGGLGQDDPEGIEYDPVRNSLFIVSNKTNSDLLEVTLAGAELNTFDLPFLTDDSSPGGVAVGPASNGSGRSVYIADRGIDNNSEPTENDGVIWEASLSGAPPTSTPTPTLAPTPPPTPSPTAQPTPTPTPPPGGPTVARISGVDRYATAAGVSSTLIDPNPPATGGTVIVASGENFPDALSGAPAAFANDAPMLLVKSGSIPSATRTELDRLDPERIYILGGTSAVSVAVENQLKGLAFTPTVTRITGVDRYATAASVAATFFVGDKTVLLASGENFPDAISAAGSASRRGWPILLTKRTSLPTSTCNRLNANDPTKIYVLGGTTAISDAVATAARACSSAGSVSVERLGGADRFATSALINAEFFTPATADHLLVATGNNFPDALAAGAVGDPVFLTSTNDLPTVVFNAIKALDPSSIHVVGGTSAVTQAVVVELQGT